MKGAPETEQLILIISPFLAPPLFKKGDKVQASVWTPAAFFFQHLKRKKQQEEEELTVDRGMRINNGLSIWSGVGLTARRKRVETNKQSSGVGGAPLPFFFFPWTCRDVRRLWSPPFNPPQRQTLDGAARNRLLLVRNLFAGCVNEKQTENLFFFFFHCRPAHANKPDCADVNVNQPIIGLVGLNVCVSLFRLVRCWICSRRVLAERRRRHSPEPWHFYFCLHGKLSQVCQFGT